MTSRLQEHVFDSRDAASSACARRIVELLTTRLAADTSSSLIVTGGSSPRNCYAQLAQASLDWSRISIVLSDERWVSSDDADSNEKLIRESLLVSAAAAANFIPLYRDGVSVSDRCAELGDEMSALPLPFAATLLGMGEDGHIASLFPDAVNLRVGLDTGGQPWCIPVRTAASAQTRISLTFSALLQSQQIILLIFGDAKREVIEKAKAGDSAFPVSLLLAQDLTPVEIFWAA